MPVGNVVSKFKSNSLRISNLDTLKAVPCRNFGRASMKRKNENNVTRFVPTVIEKKTIMQYSVWESWNPNNGTLAPTHIIVCWKEMAFWPLLWGARGQEECLLGYPAGVKPQWKQSSRSWCWQKNLLFKIIKFKRGGQPCQRSVWKLLKINIQI